MSPPINPSSTHRRVLALLESPHSVRGIAAQLAIGRKQASRALWHMQRRGLVRVVATRPCYLYSTGAAVVVTTGHPMLAAMQSAARAANRIYAKEER